MTEEQTDTKPAVDNVMDYVPQPAVRWDVTADGLVTLRIPKFSNRWLRKYLLPRLKHPDMAIHLDNYGTLVWNQMNGTRTVLEIGQDLESSFGEAVHPVYERLGLFINMLAQRRYITLEKPGESA